MATTLRGAQRVWFARGLRGMIAKRIQIDLLRQGFVVGPAERFVDGDYGANTTEAIQRLQKARALAQSGTVDGGTWRQLTDDPVPSLFERALGLTAAFEGHGFGRVAGNFDGAGLTWGVIGFTLKHHEIQRVLRDAEAAAPGTLMRAMGALAAQWLAVSTQPIAAQLAWADSISSAPDRTSVTPAWRVAFARLGDEPAVKRIQIQRAYERYFVPAAASAARLRLRRELGVALAFDVHVQNGGFKAATLALSDALASGLPEPARRRAIADSVANSAALRWRADVRARKLVFAAGDGQVHGAAYRLAAWGLAEAPAA